MINVEASMIYFIVLLGLALSAVETVVQSAPIELVSPTGTYSGDLFVTKLLQQGKSNAAKSITTISMIGGTEATTKEFSMKLFGSATRQYGSDGLAFVNKYDLPGKKEAIVFDCTAASGNVIRNRLDSCRDIAHFFAEFSDSIIMHVWGTDAGRNIGVNKEIIRGFVRSYIDLHASSSSSDKRRRRGNDNKPKLFLVVHGATSAGLSREAVSSSILEMAVRLWKETATEDNCRLPSLEKCFDVFVMPLPPAKIGSKENAGYRKAITELKLLLTKPAQTVTGTVPVSKKAATAARAALSGRIAAAWRRVSDNTAVLKIGDHTALLASASKSSPSSSPSSPSSPSPSPSLGTVSGAGSGVYMSGRALSNVPSAQRVVQGKYEYILVQCIEKFRSAFPRVLAETPAKTTPSMASTASAADAAKAKAKAKAKETAKKGAKESKQGLGSFLGSVGDSIGKGGKSSRRTFGEAAFALMAEVVTDFDRATSVYVRTLSTDLAEGMAPIRQDMRNQLLLFASTSIGVEQRRRLRALEQQARVRLRSLLNEHVQKKAVLPGREEVREILNETIEGRGGVREQFEAITLQGRGGTLTSSTSSSGDSGDNGPSKAGKKEGTSASASAGVGSGSGSGVVAYTLSGVDLFSQVDQAVEAAATVPDGLGSAFGAGVGGIGSIAARDSNRASMGMGFCDEDGSWLRLDQGLAAIAQAYGTTIGAQNDLATARRRAAAAENRAKSVAQRIGDGLKVAFYNPLRGGMPGAPPSPGQPGQKPVAAKRKLLPQLAFGLDVTAMANPIGRGNVEFGVTYSKGPGSFTLGCQNNGRLLLEESEDETGYVESDGTRFRIQPKINVDIDWT